MPEHEKEQQMHDEDARERRRREVIERALANEELMRQVQDSLARYRRGEKGIPGPQVFEEARQAWEARKRRGEL